MPSFSLINNVCAERILYIYDIKEQYFKYRLQYNPRSPQLVSSLISSFSWIDTKEGYDFWSNKNKLAMNLYDPITK